ncbi:T-cell surface glycoprotein CD8 beta chain [Dissostichus eleginoides]|uniref:T-cell surface glycoprotein CD8 beta chain n=1 Tax=Dissostichus eleginoides TaxID=100907 RepID=A0AAD9BU47_DISEL|nr:T-cell surface glycoprotein CD8 beta chain [Dissostichus eleginoides]
MKTFTLIKALSLCSFCSTSVPVSVEVQPGEDATLTCANISKFDTNTYWFRLVNRTEVSCVAMMINSYSEVSYCDGVKKSKFEMTSNTSNLFLEIKQVDVSDSGLYFCGFNKEGKLYFSTARLSITGSDEQDVDMDIKYKSSTSVPVSVEVQPGEDATLTCANISKYDTVAYWFRLVNRTEVSCVAVRISSYSEVSYYDGVQKSKFEMTYNTSNLFLKIKQVDVSDSGLYFCGFNIDGIPYFNTTRLTITESDEVAALTSVMLGVLTVLLIIGIIGLVVQYRKLQTEYGHCEDLNYATVNIQRKARRREPEPNVIYAATR